MKIAYLIPQFPGQTHAFFWRERRCLQALGAKVWLFSTRRPPQRIVSHTWSTQAQEETVYLSPLAARDALVAAAALLRAGPVGWARCLATLWRAEGLRGNQRLRLITLVAPAARLAAAARQRGIHHMHVHSCADSANVALLMHALAGVRYSLTLHGALGDYGPNQREKWSHAAFAIVVSEALRKQVETELAGALPAHVAVAPMGVELARFERQAPYEPWDGTEPFRVFCCGRLNEGKGHSTLIRAVARLRDRGVDARLRIAGEDEQGGTGYRRDLEQLIADEGLDDVVSLLGAVSEDDVRDELMQAHAFALATRHEALGVSLMEAMAMEVPTVSTQVGGVPELITSESHGLLVPRDDEHALADALRRIACEPGLAARLGAAARQRIVERYSSEQSARILFEQIQRSMQADSHEPDLRIAEAR